LVRGLTLEARRTGRSEIAAMNDTANRRFPLGTTLGAALVLAVLVAGWLISESWLDRRQRDAVLLKLEPSSGSCAVRVKGLPASNPAAVVAALRTLQRVAPHHSHLAATFSVEVICSPGGVSLVLARDSERAHEYWVFDRTGQAAAAPVAAGNEVGRISSGAFDDIR
jgi:hypothetical protein